MIALQRYTDAFLGMFFPRLCLACGSNLPPEKEHVCIHCQYYLPETGFHLDLENPFTQRFWGRVKIEGGAAMYYFLKNGRTQRLIHNLKYNNKREIGIRLGRRYGKDLLSGKGFENMDLILPVPLHPKKEHLRGYNQSDLIAQGLAEVMGIPWKRNLLVRVVFTETQTRKSKMERLENVSAAFKVVDPDLLKGKHVLIVDDVLTTGATLEVCAQKVLEVPGTKVSLATIAYAKV